MQRSFGAALVAAATLMVATPVPAQQFEYVQNDDLNFGVSSQTALTLGLIASDEWFVARLRNDTGSNFIATEVQFLIAAPDTVQDPTAGLLCGSTPVLDDIAFELRIWNDDGATTEPGTQIYNYPTGEDVARANVDSVTRVPLDGTLTIEPSGWIRVGVRFPEGSNLCGGSLVQDTTARIGELRNLLFGTLIPCPLDDPVLGEICQVAEDLMIDLGECEDETPAWRDFNAGCSAVPPGPGATGDLAIRLARLANDTPDDGRPDLGSPDTGAPDAGTPDQGTGDIPVTPDALVITRISPSMGPSNLDVEVTLTGTGFAEGLSVRIGPRTLENLAVDGSTEAIADLTSGLPVGIYDVIASLGSDEFVFADGYQVTDAEFEAPSIRSIDPVSANEGSAVTVTISGSGFREGAEVLFNGQSLFNVDVRGSGTITAETRQTMAANVYDVRVVNEDGQFDDLLGAFEIVSSASPDEGCCQVAGSDGRPRDSLLWLAGLVGMALLRRRRG